MADGIPEEKAALIRGGLEEAYDHGYSAGYRDGLEDAKAALRRMEDLYGAAGSPAPAKPVEPVEKCQKCGGRGGGKYLTDASGLWDHCPDCNGTGKPVVDAS